LHAFEDEWDFRRVLEVEQIILAKESPITFRDALEPWNICPFQTWVDKFLGLVVVS
jgi:hypothetical protein